MILSEGAGAVVLAREGRLILEKIHPGRNFRRQSELIRELEVIGRELRDDQGFDLFLASANGTFVDAAEKAVITKYFSGGKSLRAQSGAGRKRGRGRFLAIDLCGPGTAETGIAVSTSTA